MTYSIIQKSQLEGAVRLDAEYYQPEFLSINKIIDSPKLKAKKLRELILRPIVTGSTPKARDCKFDGTDIKFIKTNTVREGFINFDLADDLPKSQSRKNSEPKDGDVLVTIIGATFSIVGRAARVFKNDPVVNINQNIALIRPNSALSPGYLEAFLRGKFGKMQLWQQSRQTEQVNLNCREVEEIRIPILDTVFQEDIEELNLTSKKLMEESIRIFKEAEDLLLEELGLGDFNEGNKLFSIVNLSECHRFNRIDADFYQQKYFDLLDIISQDKLEKLRNIAKRINQNQKITADLEYEYTEISDVNVSNCECISNTIIGKELPANAKIGVKGGELIISKVRPTRGAIAIIPEIIGKNRLISGAFSVFKIDSPARECLQVVLRSIVGKLQMERPCTGTSYPTITDQDVENILIPVLPPEAQQKIADLVKKSHTARQKSKELLEEAKRKVEELIEKGGE